jgi:hypothetical protein
MSYRVLLVPRKSAISLQFPNPCLNKDPITFQDLQIKEALPLQTIHCHKVDNQAYL